MRKAFKDDPTAKIAQNAVTSNALSDVALRRDLVQEIDSTFSTKLDDWKVTNQRNSGRCWLFATLNLFRPGTMKKMNVKKFSRYVAEAKEESFPVNQGHAYEFVLAAAMVARFTDRFDDGTPEPLTAASVEDVMKKYFAGFRAWEVEEGDGLDSVEFDGSGLPPEVLGALSNPATRRLKEVQALVKTAIEAVNKNGTLKRLSDEVITNGKPDVVDVVCGGTSGQMKTKSDVDVYVNEDIYKTVKKAKKKLLKVSINYTGPVEAPIKKNQIVGKLKLVYDQELINEYDLLAAEDIKKVNILTRLLRSLNFLIWGDV